MPAQDPPVLAPFAHVMTGQQQSRDEKHANQKVRDKQAGLHADSP